MCEVGTVIGTGWGPFGGKNYPGQPLHVGLYSLSGPLLPLAPAATVSLFLSLCYSLSLPGLSLLAANAVPFLLSMITNVAAAVFAHTR